MKTYLLFAGAVYYPGRAWQDFKGSFDSEAEAIHAAANTECDWWQVVSLTTQSIVAEGQRAFN